MAAVGALLAAAPPMKAESTAPLGRQMANFTLRDYRGRERSLDELAEARLVVVAFLGTECPLAKLYGPRLAKLQAEFGDRSVAFLGIDSNRQDGVTEMADYARLHGIEFPLVKDPESAVADAFGAQRTPEVFVLDQSRAVRYAGAIDDQYGIGFQRKAPTQRYLAEALEALLKGESPAEPQTTAVGCQIGRPAKTTPSGDVTYAKDIAPILNSRCVECHRDGEIAPFPLATYDDTLGWGETIVEVISENRMPPWYADPQHGQFKNDARLSDDQKRLIATWVENGCPEGDPADLPPEPAFVEGWRIQQPDQVIAMSDKPFKVPAEGVVDYQYYVVDPQWEEDKYVVAVEARPGTRAVVHHIIVYLLAPGADPQKDHARRLMVGYAPGSPPNVLGPGQAIHVPAKSKLLFELHYTPNGSEHTDLSYAGFAFTEREKVSTTIGGRAAINESFTIPPGAADYEVVAEYRARRDEQLLKMFPHMHLRGKSFRYEAIYPDDRREILLDVPAYSFNWQLSYVLAEPKPLPKGTRIVCTANYDNSKDNPNNPDPNAKVRWGQQSWDEMMIGFFDVIDAEQPSDAASKAGS
jgi:peroxiredoxin